MVLCLGAAPAQALINPNYTVVELVRDSGQVLVVRASAPQAGQFQADVVEALVGQMPAKRQLTFDFREAEELDEQDVLRAFGGAPAAIGVMCVLKRQQRGQVVGALQIGTTWMGLVQDATGAAWLLDRDPNDLETVWGSSARQLIPAIRYALSDPRAAFPVAAKMTWGRDLALGRLDGPARGFLVTTAGIILLGESGNRVFQPGTAGEPPQDITAKLGLAVASKALAAGDLNADGQLDLVSWDGTRLQLLPGNTGGTFGTPEAGYELAACCSLAVLGRRVVVGASDGVILLELKGTSGFAAQRLATGAAALGPGGVCAVADFNDDGAADIVQLFARGLAFYAGRREPEVFGAPMITSMDIVRHPAVVVCGDYDTDGQLDLIVGGEGGSTLLSRGEDGAWRCAVAETGEYGAASGLGQGESVVVGACASELNGDARQGVALFYAASPPSFFFNRGFACFGVARSLELAESNLPAARSLAAGQMAGLLADLNGDLVPDLLAVDRQQGVWAIFGQANESRRFQVAVSLADAASGPLAVTAVMDQRPLGIWVIRPGEPTTISVPLAGKLTLRWKQPDGTGASRDVVVVRPTAVAL